MSRAIRLQLLTRLALPQFILLAPLASFLIYHRYDPLRGEAIIEIVLVAIMGFVTAALLWRGGPGLRAAVLAALLLIFADLSLTLGKDLPRLVQGVIPIQTGWTALAAMAVGYAVLYGLVRALGRHGETLLAVVFGVVLVSTLLLPGEGVFDRTVLGQPREARKDLPLVVHMVLDEHAAYSAFPDEAEGTAEVRQAMAALYVDNGFRLWTRAFSRTADSEISMAATFNALSDFEQGLPIREGSGPLPYTLTANAYFDEVARRGWRIHAFQGHHMDYCLTRPASVEACRTFASSSPRLFMNTNEPVAQKFVTLHSLFWRGSFVHYAARRAYQRLVKATGVLPWWPERDNITPVTSLTMFDEILAGARAGGRGTMVFAHLFVPHHPYAFKADCSLRPYNEDWVFLNDAELPRPTINTAEGRAMRYQLYAEQVRCVTRTMAKFFDGLRAAGLWDDTIVIVHGDHGSRITLVEPDAENRALLTAADLRDNFLTHLAVKMPGVTPGFDQDPRAIQDIIPHLTMGRPMPPAGDYVFLTARSRKGDFLRVPLADLELPGN